MLVNAAKPNPTAKHAMKMGVSKYAVAVLALVSTIISVVGVTQRKYHAANK
jgi:hypothetical protein